MKKNILTASLFLFLGQLGVAQEYNSLETFAPESGGVRYKVFDGIASINDYPLEIHDRIAALDEKGNLVGLYKIDETTVGRAKFDLEIYEDFEEDGHDGGMNEGEMYTIAFYDDSESAYYELGNYGPWTATGENGVMADGDTQLVYDVSGEPTPLTEEVFSFTAKKMNQHILVNWVTNTEENQPSFIIEKSKDGKNFSILEKIKGQGESSTIQNYQWLDETPFIGANYYRLTAVTGSNKQKNSKVMTVHFQDNKQGDFAISPNPTNGPITISSESLKSETQEFRVVNMVGKVLLKQSIPAPTDKLSMNIGHLPAGIYNLQLVGENKVQNELVEIK